jgi:hypothetical protein
VTTKQKGDISEAQVLAAFLKAGFNVLIPFGDRNRYDCVIEQNGTFKRIQVKTARFIGSSLVFGGYSVTTENGRIKHAHYKGDVELFAVYSPDLNKIYLVPPDRCRDRETRLSLSGVSRNQYSVLLASDFEWPRSSAAEQALDKGEAAGAIPAVATTSSSNRA